MKEQIANVQADALTQIAGIADMKALEDARVSILGKKGSLTQVQQGMRNVAKEDKPAVGAMLNEARATITAALEERKAALQAELDAAAAVEGHRGRRRLRHCDDRLRFAICIGCHDSCSGELLIFLALEIYRGHLLATLKLKLHAAKDIAEGNIIGLTHSHH